MKILQVNTVAETGSVGRICVDLYEVMKECGYQPSLAIGRGALPPELQGLEIGNKRDFYSHVAANFIFGKAGFASREVTLKFIQWLRETKPDIIHLHNIHGFYLQTELLFAYLKEADVPVVWTLHDCWAFTGHCAYFDYTGCDKWQQEKGCHSCKVHRRVYPYALLKDNSAQNYQNKKEAYCGVGKLTIVTPSHWLAGLVKKSFLKDYPVVVIPNGINLKSFCPKVSKENTAETGKSAHIVLGVANRWEERKGLKYFERLARELPEGYEIRLVGLADSQIKRIKKAFPDGRVRPIARTATVDILAEHYREADVYVNATLEDNFPTTNLEALACGTPVITFDTGGSPEALTKDCGMVIPKGNFAELLKAVCHVCTNAPFSPEDCRKQALRYGREERYMEYISLYEQVSDKGLYGYENS